MRHLETYKEGGIKGWTMGLNKEGDVWFLKQVEPLTSNSHLNFFFLQAPQQKQLDKLCKRFLHTILTSGYNEEREDLIKNADEYDEERKSKNIEKNDS